MKRKINLRLLGVSTIAIVITVLLVVSVFYEIFKQEIIEELKNDTRIFKVSHFFETEDQAEKAALLDNLRITIIAGDGTVKFDNYTDSSKMENHKERPEIVAAMTQGEGLSIRKSSTLGKNTFYFAIKQDDGTILRVAKDADNIWIIFRNALPIIMMIVFFLFILCVIVAHFLTKSLVEPIEEIAMNIEKCGDVSTYKELIPFVTTIKEQHQDILRSAKMRQEFTANVSHELKTPLTSISGYAELIESGMASEIDIRRFAGEIQRNAKRLLNLINDIIKLSEMDASDIEVQFETIDLFEVARESVEMLNLSALQHEVDMTLIGKSCLVRGNKSMLEEVVYNLCDNAIRYNNKGGKVKIEVKKREKQCVLVVTDTGIGISKENQARVFERFYRVDKSRSKGTGGTGLGLAIVKHIIAQHNAQLEIQSEEGKGTSISVCFKIEE